MVDTTTTVLLLTKQTIGGNRNTWGNILNTNFDQVEEAICGRHAVSTTGGTTTPTQAQMRKRYVDVTGTLVSDATIVVPNFSKSWIFTNSASGDFAVLVKTASGTATSVPAGCSVEITCDGANGVLRADRNEVGQMAFFGNSAAPNGWFECTGATKSRAGRGIDLFGKIGEVWSAGNGVTTFGLPDAYTAGRFLRSRTASIGIGVTQDDQNKAHLHSGSTASTTLSMAGTATSGGGHTPTGSAGVDDPTHNHVISVAITAINYQPGGSSSGTLLAAGSSAPFNSENASVQHTHAILIDPVSGHTHSVDFTGSSASTTVTVASDGGTESRPTNISAILCIRY